MSAIPDSGAFSEVTYKDRWDVDIYDGPTVKASIEYDATQTDRALAAIDKVAQQLRDNVMEGAAAYVRHAGRGVPVSGDTIPDLISRRVDETGTDGVATFLDGKAVLNRGDYDRMRRSEVTAAAPRGLNARCETCDWITSGATFGEVTRSIVEHSNKTGHEDVLRDDEERRGDTWGDGNPRVPGESFDDYNARMIEGINSIPDDHLARHPDGTLDTEAPCWCGTRLVERMQCPRHGFAP